MVPDGGIRERFHLLSIIGQANRLGEHRIFNFLQNQSDYTIVN